MSSVILPPNNGSSGLHVSQDGFSLHLTYLAWISSAISCDLATMSSVTPEVESLACSVNKATLAEAAAASALAASTKDVKHSCESDCPLQLVWTFCAASCASDWAASNAACSASHPKEDLGGLAMMSSTSPKEMSPWMLLRISSKQPDTSTAHSCAFAPAASALSFASSTDLVTHSLTASTSPTQCSKYALFAVASSCICFSIKFAFASNASASAFSLSCIFSPQATTSPTQDSNFAFASATAACVCARTSPSPSPKEKVSVTPLPISEKQDWNASVEAVHDCNFSHDASDSSCAFFKSASMHAFTASTSPTQFWKCSEDSAVFSWTCLAINAAFACNILAFAVIFAFIFSPHTLTSPTQSCNSLPAASASDLNLAISASNSAEVLAIKSLSSALSSQPSTLDASLVPPDVAFVMHA